MREVRDNLPPSRPAVAVGTAGSGSTLPVPRDAPVSGSPVVLFDLDGTLLDSAPDLAAAVNEMRRVRGQDPLPFPLLREHAGSGARGMLREGFGCQPPDPAYTALRDEFHDRYAAAMVVHTRPFAGIEDMLARIAGADRRWGIVTNKAIRFAQPLVTAFDELGTAAVLVAGDSTPHAKPHPAPLIEAARRLGVDPTLCVYVGDDERDVAAGRAAGMRTGVAGWGYIGGSASPAAAWGADVLLESPKAVLKWLDLA